MLNIISTTLDSMILKIQEFRKTYKHDQILITQSANAARTHTRWVWIDFVYKYTTSSSLFRFQFITGHFQQLLTVNVYMPDRVVICTLQQTQKVSEYSEPTTWEKKYILSIHVFILLKLFEIWFNQLDIFMD